MYKNDEIIILADHIFISEDGGSVFLYDNGNLTGVINGVEYILPGVLHGVEYILPAYNKEN